MGCSVLLVKLRDNYANAAKLFLFLGSNRLDSQCDKKKGGNRKE